MHTWCYKTSKLSFKLTESILEHKYNPQSWQQQAIWKPSIQFYSRDPLNPKESLDKGRAKYGLQATAGLPAILCGLQGP